MRKAVKLAAMSTLAAVAMVGGAATGASADSGHKVSDVTCGNKVTPGLLAADRFGEASIDDHSEVEVDKKDQTLCQEGNENFGVNYYEGDDIEGSTVVDQIADLLGGVLSVGDVTTTA
jgi:hypothetical protein